MDQVFFSTEKRWSALIILIVTLILITPVCGFLFQCGCDWPWLGLDSNCNYYRPYEVHKCPWCASMVTGIFSTGITIIGGVFATVIPVIFLAAPSKSYQLDLRNEVVVRILMGAGIFFLLAIFTASVAAYWQDYVLGVGRYFVA